MDNETNPLPVWQSDGYRPEYCTHCNHPIGYGYFLASREGKRIVFRHAEKGAIPQLPDCKRWW